MVLILAVVMVRLGFWQLDRNQEVSLENEISQARFENDPLDLEVMVMAAGTEFATLEYRPSFANGVYDPSQEVLLRGQAHSGLSGFRVITPLVLADGVSAVMVDRGWVPLSAQSPPVSEAPPPASEVQISGIVRASQTRMGFGRVDPEGSVIVSRVDLELLDRSISYQLLPVYLQVFDRGDGIYPLGAEPPDFSDNGNHIYYALQWFSFTGVLLVGYPFLVRTRLRRQGKGKVDDRERAGPLEPDSPSTIDLPGHQLNRSCSQPKGRARQ